MKQIVSIIVGLLISTSALAEVNRSELSQEAVDLGNAAIACAQELAAAKRSGEQVVQVYSSKVSAPHAHRFSKSYSFVLVSGKSIIATTNVFGLSGKMTTGCRVF